MPHIFQAVICGQHKQHKHVVLLFLQASKTSQTIHKRGTNRLNKNYRSVQNIYISNSSE